jgi:hypothetical protein
MKAPWIGKPLPPLPKPLEIVNFLPKKKELWLDDSKVQSVLHVAKKEESPQKKLKQEFLNFNEMRPIPLFLDADVPPQHQHGIVSAKSPKIDPPLQSMVFQDPRPLFLDNDDLDYSDPQSSTQDAEAVPSSAPIFLESFEVFHQL